MIVAAKIEDKKFFFAKYRLPSHTANHFSFMGPFDLDLYLDLGD